MFILLDMIGKRGGGWRSKTGGGGVGWKNQKLCYLFYANGTCTLQIPWQWGKNTKP